jgi:hypothetical protein
MSSNDPMEKALDEMAERLIRLGFATRYFVNEQTGITSLEWTDSGKVLRENIRLIFNSPTAPNQIGQFEIPAFLGIIFSNVSL